MAGSVLPQCDAEGRCAGRSSRRAARPSVEACCLGMASTPRRSIDLVPELTRQSALDWRSTEGSHGRTRSAGPAPPIGTWVAPFVRDPRNMSGSKTSCNLRVTLARRTCCAVLYRWPQYPSNRTWWMPDGSGEPWGRCAPSYELPPISRAAPAATRASSTTITKALGGSQSTICFPVQDPAKLAGTSTSPMRPVAWVSTAAVL
jgi:hypothetical protein